MLQIRSFRILGLLLFWTFALLVLLPQFLTRTKQFLSAPPKALPKVTKENPPLIRAVHAEFLRYRFFPRNVTNHEYMRLEAFLDSSGINYQNLFHHLAVDDAETWRKRLRGDVKIYLAQFDAYFEAVHRFFNVSSQECHKKVRPPVLVLGTAGTGTRVFDTILTLSGLYTSRIANRQKDSKVFIEWVKSLPEFGLPVSNNTNATGDGDVQENDDVPEFPSQGKSIETVLDWILQQNNLDYLNETRMESNVSKALQFGVHKMARFLELELWLRTKTRVTPESSFPFQRFYLTESPYQLEKINDVSYEYAYWGFKEPQCLFVLPFLLNEWAESLSGPLTIVHVIRDGRDIAFSKQQRRKYQRVYVSKLTSEMDYSDQDIDPDWVYTMQVAVVWQKMNLAIRQWASVQGQRVRYIPVRLEDVCNESIRHSIIRKMLESIYVDAHTDLVPTDNEIEKILKSAIDQSRCRTGKYRDQNPLLVRMIDSKIQEGLETFGYGLMDDNEDGSLDILQQSNASKEPSRLSKLLDVARLHISSRLNPVATIHGNPVVIMTFATRTYIRVLLNWLLFLQNIKINYPILVCTTDQSVFNLLSFIPEGDIDEEDAQYLDVFESLVKSMRIVPYIIEGDVNGNVPNSLIWSFRIRATKALLEDSVDVLVTDLDAIWIQDPLPHLEKILDKHPNTDVITSRGRFPYAIGYNWGGTACMGFIYFRASAMTLKLLTRTNILIQVTQDDQVALNYAIQDFLPVDSEPWRQLHLPFLPKNDSYSLFSLPQEDDKRERIDHRNISVLILPFSIVPRYCSNDMKIQQSFDVVTVYPDAWVVHCYTPKFQEKKEEWFRQINLWKVLE